jgi:hypothetical protein
MSDKNLTALREGFERFEREGAPIFDLLDPEVEILNFDSFPVTRPYLGREGAIGLDDDAGFGTAEVRARFRREEHGSGAW